MRSIVSYNKFVTDKILKSFDFATMQNIMYSMNWTWRGSQNTPTIPEMKSSLKDLLDRNSGGSGGFVISRNNNEIIVSFNPVNFIFNSGVNIWDDGDWGVFDDCIRNLRIALNGLDEHPLKNYSEHGLEVMVMQMLSNIHDSDIYDYNQYGFSYEMGVAVCVVSFNILEKKYKCR